MSNKDKDKPPEGWKEVNFTRESWARLKARHAHAVANKEDTFEFEGETYVTSFAKYFIEFHDEKFGGKP